MLTLHRNDDSCYRNMPVATPLVYKYQTTYVLLQKSMVLSSFFNRYIIFYALGDPFITLDQ